ncbi:23S ribosomal RNA methyltransferase Erm [Intrasporangium sp.]|uniref:23S ribosomal RNA methyltransferase Erm n=1 Tax=Intrasporangium sp. TaxID=1925024 RepID=UPI00293990A9|nr:23S ribosomal RNA methyltransferase Erm [Intrasporangium sp.]MDV3220802.1 23S ribosomal RNA methyltransferase Erm [Intrasporangium sp.]
MSRTLPGPHELGQNHLIDRRVAARIVTLVRAAEPPLPIVEWAAGRGAITRPLIRLGRPVEAVELDPRSIARLRQAVGDRVTVSRCDILRHAPPEAPHDLVCNVPFHLTTPVIRRLLALRHWRRAVLLTQWEVARKRAAVGGTTLLTAQWWPWYEFRLDRRVPSSSFAPRPSVDGGILVVDRRRETLLAEDDQHAYQQFVASAFSGRGRGIAEILRRHGLSKATLRTWRRAHGVRERDLPRDVTAHAWVDAYHHATRATPSRRSPR